MRIHYLSRVFIVTERIETCINRVLNINHVQIDITAVWGPQTFPILNKSALFRLCDAYKIWLVERSVTEGPGIGVRCRCLENGTLQKKYKTVKYFRNRNTQKRITYARNFSRVVINCLIVVDSQFVLGKIGLTWCMKWIRSVKLQFLTVHFLAVC